MNILHGLLSLDIGGLERLVLGLVCEATKAGHSVSVLCIEREGAMAEVVRKAGAEVLSLDKPPGRLPAFRRRAAELLMDLRPDVIHTHQIGAAWYLGPGAAELGVPMLHTEHGNHFSKSDGWLMRVKRVLFSRNAAKRIERFCCVSSEISDSIKRYKIASPSRVAVVKNGVDLKPFADLPSSVQARKAFGIPENALVLGTVGRLAEIKRQDRLLRAVASLLERFPNLWVLIVGDGPERKRLEEVSRQLNLVDRCVFAGFQEHPEIALRAMDLFALTSRSEGFPVSILEAWAAGVPVVCSAVGGVPDVVEEGKLGLLFDADDFGGLCRAVEKLLVDRTLAESMARQAKAKVEEEYSLSQMAQTYEHEYAKLIEAKRGSPLCAS